MSNEFYNASGWPASKSAGVSSTGRAEMILVQAAFDKLPTMSGNGLKLVQVNAGGTALQSLATTGTGSAVLATSPTLVTPVLGVATATSINGVGYTGTAGKTLTVSNSLTLVGTDGSTLNIGGGGTLGTAAYTAASAYAAVGATFNLGTTALALNRASAGVALTGITSIDGQAATVVTNANLTGPITSVGNATSVASQTGTGNKFVMDTSPTLVTPVLGVATATSVNKVALTAPASGSTLTIADGKTLTLSNTLTFAGVDGSSLNVAAGGFMPCHIQEFRLTNLTGEAAFPVDTTAGTIYLTPYTGNQIALYNGSTGWVVRQSGEMSVAVPAVANKMHDVFCFDNAGTPTLEVLAWTDDNNRATGIVRQDGVWVKSGATTRRYVGSFRTNGANQVPDTRAARWLWNMNNRLARSMAVIESTASWNYSVATVRQARAAGTNQVDFILGIAEEAVDARVTIASSNSSSAGHAVGIGLDSTTTFHPDCSAGYAESNIAATVVATLSVLPTTPGRHVLVWLEVSVALGTTAWLSSISGGGLAEQHGGIVGTVRA